MRRLAFTFAVALFLAGPAMAASPADPQPSADQLQPGLAVDFYFGFFRHINEFADWTVNNGKKGDPIPQVNWRVGKGEVLSSGKDDGVGVRLSGFILLDTPGDYKFTFQSNDGVRLLIDNQEIVEDPDVHADRYSDIGTLHVTEPGWYPIRIIYFERKNTSTLIFYWRPASSTGAEGSMPIVPPEVLAHIPRKY